MLRFTLWLVLAWLTPALIAGAFGWKGIWGSGGAGVDYLIPIPVAGGFLHAITFGAVTALLLAQKNRPALLHGATRGVLLGLSLAAAAQLLDLEAIRVAATTDVSLRRLPWQENPLGLFLLTDTLIAQLFLGAFGGRWPAAPREWLASAAAVVLLPAAYALAAVSQDSRASQPFTYGGSREGPARGDEVVFVFTRIPPESGKFRPAAESFAAQWHPGASINSEDTAVHFFTSLDAARKLDAARAVLTYCMYEDGTPPAWMGGAGDCFSRHETFSERVARFIEAQDRQLPMDERVRLARTQACDGAKLPQRPWHENNSTRTCLPRPP